jgi:hypothetical protein
VWSKERAARNQAEEQVTELAARLTPKLHVYIEGDGIREAPTDYGSGKWVQFTVEGSLDAPLEQCEARITKIDRINANGHVVASLIEEPITM